MIKLSTRAIVKQNKRPKSENVPTHHSFLKKIKKPITVSAQEIECLSHSINVSSLKISRGKNLERPEDAIKKNQSDRTREALNCIQKCQKQRFLQENFKQNKKKAISAH